MKASIVYKEADYSIGKDCTGNKRMMKKCLWTVRLLAGQRHFKEHISYVLVIKMHKKDAISACFGALMVPFLCIFKTIIYIAFSTCSALIFTHNFSHCACFSLAVSSGSSTFFHCFHEAGDGATQKNDKGRIFRYTGPLFGGTAPGF